MADENSAATPQLKTLSQYARSIHFTNDAATNNTATTGTPEINVRVNITDEKAGPQHYIVMLDMQVEANSDEDAVFTVELEYIGVFEVTGVAEDKIQAVLHIECPRLLFPFARRLIADSTREGGFPPLMLDPIDFRALFVQQHANGADEHTPSEPEAGGNGPH